MAVLVVDDERTIREAVARALRMHGYDVALAADGDQALQTVAVLRPEVIVLDLMMPRLDGIAVVRYLTQYCPEKLPNVIVTTAFGSAAMEKVCPPVHHFLEKPFDVAVLVAQAIDCCRAL